MRSVDRPIVTISKFVCVFASSILLTNNQGELAALHHQHQILRRYQALRHLIDAVYQVWPPSTPVEVARCCLARGRLCGLLCVRPPVALIKLRPPVLDVRPGPNSLGGTQSADSRLSWGSMHVAMIRSLSIDCNCCDSSGCLDTITCYMKGICFAILLVTNHDHI